MKLDHVEISEARSNPAQSVSEVLNELVRRTVETEISRRLAVEASSVLPAADLGRSPLLSIKEMALRMPPGSRSEASVRRHIQAGRIPAKKIGSTWGLDPVAVLAELHKSGTGKGRVVEFLSKWKAHEDRHKNSKKWPGISHGKRGKV